jgi:electron transfer flavoprotein beta subunit
MRIVVCLKTPSGAAVDKDDAFIRAGRCGPGQLPSFDKNALEEALRIKERLGTGEVVAATVAGGETTGALREALAIGADRASLLADPSLEAGDVLARSRALAALLAAEAADLYLTCSWSGDIDGTLLWSMTAERMGLPVMCQVRRLSVEGQQVTGERQAESGDLSMSCALPALVEVSSGINKPRYMTLKGKAHARAKALRLLRSADLSLQDDGAGAKSSGTCLVSLAAAPRVRSPVLVEDESQAAPAIYNFLKERKFVR